MYMSCASQLLAGARPYLDLVEVNPPLAWVVYVVPEFVAQKLAAFHLPASVGFHAVIVVYAALAFALVSPLVSAARRRAFATAWILCQLLTVVVPFRLYWMDHWASVPLAQWGQREHLFAIATAAWLAVRAARSADAPVGRPRAIGIGVLSGVMASLKPHFLVVLLSTEIVAWLSRLRGQDSRARSIRGWLAPEMIACASVALLYSAQFALWPADWRSAAFSRWLPFIAANYDRAYGASLDQVAIHALPSALAVAFAWGAGLAFIRKARHEASGATSELVLRLLVFSTAAVLIAVGQRKGFMYHFVPAQSGVLLVLGLTFPAPGSVRRWVRVSLAGLVPCAAALCLLLPVQRLAPRFTDSLEVALDGAELPPGSAVLVLGDAVLGPWPALRMRGLVQASRFPWFFPLPLALSMPEGPARDAEEARLAREVALDVQNRDPEIILIQAERLQALPRGFDLRGWLMRFPETRRAFSGFGFWYRVGPWWVAARRQLGETPGL
jgi:hypothetical protein